MSTRKNERKKTLIDKREKSPNVKPREQCLFSLRKKRKRTIREKVKNNFKRVPTIASNALTYQHYSKCKASEAKRDLRA